MILFKVGILAYKRQGNYQWVSSYDESGYFDYDVTSIDEMNALFPPSATYANQICRIKTTEKIWRNATAGDYTNGIVGLSYEQPPTSDYLPPASNYAIGYVGKVTSTTYGTNYYMVVYKYNYYKCIIV